MYEGDLRSTGSDFRFAIDQACLFILESAQLLIDIINAEADVMQSLSSLRQKLSDGSFRSEGFEQFDVRVSGVQFSHLYALFFHRFNGKTLQSKRILIEAQSILKAAHRNRYVINSLHYPYGPPPPYPV